MTVYVPVYPFIPDRRLTEPRSCFVKQGQLFKLRYTYIDLCKDPTGALRCLELGGGVGQQTPFVHTCELLPL